MTNNYFIIFLYTNNIMNSFYGGERKEKMQEGKEMRRQFDEENIDRVDIAKYNRAFKKFLEYQHNTKGNPTTKQLDSIHRKAIKKALSLMYKEDKKNRRSNKIELDYDVPNRDLSEFPYTQQESYERHINKVPRIANRFHYEEDPAQFPPPHFWSSDKKTVPRLVNRFNYDEEPVSYSIAPRLPSPGFNFDFHESSALFRPLHQEEIPSDNEMNFNYDLYN